MQLVLLILEVLIEVISAKEGCIAIDILEATRNPKKRIAPRRISLLPKLVVNIVRCALCSYCLLSHSYTKLHVHSYIGREPTLR